jgi:osmoprotectant transport system ATP-binding protein
MVIEAKDKKDRDIHAMIELISVSKSYGKEEILHSVTLTAQEGKTTILLGQSGCGKSTILRMIIGIVKPDAGRILVNRTDMARTDILEMRRNIGYVLQDGGLFPHMTGRRNVSFMAEYLHWDPDRINKRVDLLSSLANLQPGILDRYPSQLSGGQKQRVSLMRALMLDPGVLLFDEPLTALDPIIRHDLQRDLRELFTKLNKTVLLVTHDIWEAAYLGDRIILMNDGAIEQEGVFDDLADRPRTSFVARFINAQTRTANRKKVE